MATKPAARKQPQKARQAPHVDGKRTAHEIFDVIRIAGRREGDLEAENVPVAAGLGDQVLLQRGLCLPVHRAHVEVLRAAKHKRYVPETDPGTGHISMVARGHTQRYPFELLFKDIPEEVYEELRTHYQQVGAKEVTENQIQKMLDDYEASLNKPMEREAKQPNGAGAS